MEVFRLYYMAVKQVTTPDPPTPDTAATAANRNVHYDTRLPRYSFWRRLQIPLIAAAAYALVRALGPTLRFETLGDHYCREVESRGQRYIGAFWHRSTFSAMWKWRGRGLVILNTTNFDGQWTRRVIERLGYGTAQGSSTRGGLRGLAIMAERLQQGYSVGFTIDGPRGPRYIAKPGPVMLARRTGAPILVFHIGLDRAYTLEQTWDLFQIPYPFSRAAMIISPPIYVPTDASAETLEHKQAEMQAELERVRDVAEGWFGFSEAERRRLRAEIGP